MLNNFCFHVYAQKSLFIAENCNAFFLTSMFFFDKTFHLCFFWDHISTLTCEFRVHRAGSQLKMDTWTRLYKTYVRCHLEYCVQAWSPYYAADKELLEKVQKRAVGMISGLSGGSYEEKLAEIGLTTLEQRRKRGDMIQTWKIVHRADNVDRSIWFKMTAD